MIQEVTQFVCDQLHCYLYVHVCLTLLRMFSDCLHDTLQILIELLLSPASNVCEQAVWALGNIIM